MKKAYQAPVLTAEEFDLVDVIAASTPEQPPEEDSTVENRNDNWGVPVEI
ncbi:MAG: hypothetical protein IJU96_08230 [Clostridia bacterium]|nr:hypothetical protein [Clostridia bacterium]